MSRNQIMISVLMIGLGVSLQCCSERIDLEQQNKAIVMQAFDAMNSKEYNKLDQFFAQDFKRYSQATPDIQVNSLDEMITFMKVWYGAFPDAFMKTRLMAADSDLVAAWVTFEGTNLAPMGPYPATGKRMESETFGFFRLENGKIAESWVTWDNLAMFNQLGLTPPTPAIKPQTGN